MKTCPNCGMPIDQEDTSEVDLDALMDDLSEKKTEDISEPMLPDMDYIEGLKDETSSPRSEMDEVAASDDPILPDMDYVSGEKEQSATPAGEMDLHLRRKESLDPEETEVVSEGPEMETLEHEVVEQETETKEPDQDAGKMLKDIDTMLQTPEYETKAQKQVEEESTVTSVVEEDVIEEELPQIKEMTSMLGMGLGKVFSLHLSQWIYWGGIFYLISFASFELISPNVGIGGLELDQFEIHPDAFLFSWLSFFVMAWFYGYKLRLQRVRTRWYYGLFFLIGLYATLTMIYIIYQLVLSLQSTASEPLMVYTVVINIMLFTAQNYIISGISAGFFLFFVGYSIVWENIYRRTPMYQLKPHLVE